VMHRDGGVVTWWRRQFNEVSTSTFHPIGKIFRCILRVCSSQSLGMVVTFFNSFETFSSQILTRVFGAKTKKVYNAKPLLLNI
jgi:hypothetical protein